ncbi:hypothetical protein E5D57_003970 [Metarhizium anisopliae]|nr:hypothetical protein E5D57_003970 [Metarhizium anisopliae]
MAPETPWAESSPRERARILTADSLALEAPAIAIENSPLRRWEIGSFNYIAAAKEGDSLQMRLRGL